MRPWQHVLEPLSGYLLLAQRMWEQPKDYCEAWNFGPDSQGVATVWDVAQEVIANYGRGELKDASNPNDPHEAQLLTLNIEKARKRLQWRPRLTLKESIGMTVDWYRRYADEDVYQLCAEQIETYLKH